MKKTDRTVHYYELALDYHDNGLNEEENLIQTFSAIINQAHKRLPERYRNLGGKFIFIQDIIIDTPYRQIKGKLRSVRTDIKPEILNMLTDTTRGIDTTDEEGIMETSHFIINYTRPRRRPVLAFEYNAQGARISDLLHYITKVGNERDLIRGGIYVPIGRGSLDSILERIRRCSEIEIKVHKDNIHQIEQLDQGTFTALSNLETAFQSEYVTIDLKYEYKSREDTKEGNNIIERIIEGFKRRPDLTKAFKKLTILAEDSEKNNLLDTFDLLIDKQKSKLRVQLIEGRSVVVSEDIFDQIEKEIGRKRLLD